MKVFVGLLAIVAVLAAWGVYKNNSSKAMGVVGGTLGGCPDMANGVCSTAENENRITPYDVSHLADPVEKLKEVIAAMPRATIIAATDFYIHAEFRSPAFHFVDDVEFLFDPSKQVIHVRSVARVGFSDLGVNRRRAEEIREMLGK